MISNKIGENFVAQTLYPLMICSAKREIKNVFFEEKQIDMD